MRQRFIDADRVRDQVNKAVARVVRMFRWAVEEEPLPAAVHQALKAVEGLRAGRTAAAESEPVRPVDDADVDAVKPHVAAPVWAMIQLQRLTGMRPGEVLAMRAADVRASGTVWEYRPASHKTQHHGKERVVLIRPKAQEVLRPWLDRAAPLACLFSSAGAETACKETVTRSQANLSFGPGRRHGRGPRVGARLHPWLSL